MSALFYAFVILIGLIIGSFLNCLIWRLYKDENLTGRSYCPKCREMIAWYDNIPLLSFIILGGRCRRCHQSIAWRYPLVELTTAVLFLLTFQQTVADPNFTLLLTHDWLVVATLLVIFVYDATWQMVPMLLVWPMTAVILVFNLLLGVPILTLLLFGLIGTAFFLIQYVLTRRRGVGEGDIWLGLMLGLTFPSGPLLLVLLVVSYGAGTLVSLILMAVGRKGWKAKIALGPFLAFGAIITLIWGEPLIRYFLGAF